MKRFVTILLAVCLLLSVAACGSTGGSSSSKASSAASSAAGSSKASSAASSAASGSSAAAKTARKSTGTDITACIASEPETIDPNKANTVDGATYSLHMFEGLMKYKSTGKPVDKDKKMMATEIVPGQAKSYEVSSDGLTYTFHLRDDIYWSDGQPVKAGDFVYSWERMIDPANAFDYGYFLDGIVKNAQEIQDKKMKPEELGVKATDDKTFVVTLASQCPYFLAMCAFGTMMPLRKDVIDKNGADWTTPGKMVSNGAYVLSEWVHDSYIKMTVNDKYYDTASIGPDSITWYLNNSQTSILAAYQSGQYDFSDDLPNDQIEKLTASGDMFINPQIGTYYLYLNTKVMSDWRVRAAMVLAVDRDNIVKRVTQGGQSPATGFVPSGTSDSANKDWTSSADSPLYKWLASKYTSYDLKTYAGRCDLAKFLYNEAVKDGKWDANTSVVYNFNTSESHKKIAEAIQSDWKSVLGMNVTLTNLDWNVYTNTLKEGKFGVARMGWIADYNDAVTFLELVTTTNSNNYGKWSDTDYDAKIAKIKSLGGGTERDKLMHEAEEKDFSEGGFPVCPLYFYTQPYVLNGKVQNAMFSPLGYYFFMYATKTK
jgi:oligopeptide transport system substrate-binding protein